MNPTIRLVLADDHAIVLNGLKRMFESQEGFEVVACCADAGQALAAIRRGPCDVLVLDLRMPGQTGLDVLRTIQSEHLSCRTVLLTAAISNEDVVEAVRLGAQGMVLKESSPESLVECVRRVHQGEQWIDRETMSRAFDHVVRRESAERETAKLLTPREIEIVRMIAQGLRNRAIADRLSITEGTVKIHLHNVYEKLKIDGRLELMLYAQAKGLI
jgi:DNA-binding NarL/FixJ family response regulator